jgi:meso-butanediol dehydrogenase / (S,S)-butanediol dehydrogenase / diacetyl reductase
MTSRRSTLEGRVAVVTGAGQGNGRAIALRLADDGAAVVVNDINERTAETVANEIVSAGGRATPIAADVSSHDDGSRLITEAQSAFGNLHILVNNAGLIRPNPFGSVSESDWDVTFAVNARGLFFLSQAAAKVMGEGSTIINVSSIAARGVPTLSPPYAASKAAVVNITQTMARSLAPAGIRVNAVCPGIIDTDFNQRLDQLIGVQQQGLNPGEFLQQRAAGVPLRRLGTAEEVASVVAFLAGPDASYITAQSINVDGGMFAS